MENELSCHRYVRWDMQNKTQLSLKSEKCAGITDALFVYYLDYS